MTDDAVSSLLERFGRDIGEIVEVTALWVHGSLALGDFQPGRSDLDLIALVDSDIDEAQRERLERVHEALPGPLAVGLHCSYMLLTQVADPAVRHLTWAQERMFDRPVSPVTRRELLDGGLTLSGRPPAGLLPAVTDDELAEFIRRDLREFWYPATAEPSRWLRDIWVDLGLLTLARATVTLRDGRLITKREALDVLIDLGAPARVVEDIRQRRYGTSRASLGSWRIHRAHLARTFVRSGITRVAA